MKVRRTAAGVAVTAAALLGPLGAGVQAGNAGGDPFAISPLSETLATGSTFSVSGEGCPPVGEFATDTPLLLLLTPPGGGNSVGPVVSDGQLAYVISAVPYPGETSVVTTPNADGTFEAAITIPGDAPGGVYTVRAFCSGLIESDGTDSGLDPQSVLAAQTEQGSVTVETAATTTSTPPMTEVPPPVVSAPTFTG